ncbi:MAG: hypothetical protein HYX89_01090 [Chloroflexi bacterium]|nr:hypothetical protein [Chloroflexota bacterium]
MCAQAAELTFSEPERLLLLYLGRHAVDYIGMGRPQRFPGAFVGLRDKGLVSAWGGSNLTLQLTTRGLEELYRLLDRHPTLRAEELTDYSQRLSEEERATLLQLIHAEGLVESVDAIAAQGAGRDAVQGLVGKGFLQYTGYPSGPTHDVYLTELGYQVARYLATRAEAP